MARIPGWIFTVVAVAAGCDPEAAKVTRVPPVEAPPVAVAVEPPVVTTPAPAVRTYPIDGRTLTATLTTSKPALMVSEPGHAILEFVGEGVEVEVSWMGRNGLGRPDNYRVKLIDAGGVALAVPDGGPQFGGKTWSVKPTADKPFAQKLLLTHWAERLAPGQHTVHVETEVRARVLPEGAWRDVAVALAVPLAVVADDPVALGELIVRLGDAAVGADYEEAEEGIRLLGAIRDPRVVAQWLRVVERPEYTRKQAAVLGLASWPDDAGLAAILKITRTRSADLPAEGYTTEALRVQSAGQLRLTAAQALATCPHPGASAALLALKTDPDDSVRLTVLHHVATLAAPVAAPLLAEFARDAAPRVRGEAERYIRERR